MNIGQIRRFRVWRILVKHLKYSQEEAGTHITKDTVFLAVKDHRVTGTVQNDTFEIIGGYFSDADFLEDTWLKMKTKTKMLMMMKTIWNDCGGF